VSTYRLDRAFALRAFGLQIVVVAVLAFLAFVLTSFDGFADGVGIGLAILAALGFVSGLRLLFLPPKLLTLDSEGYRAARRAGGDTFRGRWEDVAEIRAPYSKGGGQLLIVEYADASQQQFPLTLVRERRMELIRDFYDRLNTSHGYRRFDPQA